MAPKAGKNILVTGPPGSGKTTLIKKISKEARYMNPAGFFTAEVRRGGEREGFEIETLEGKRRVLSHVEISSRFRVGRYGVDMAGFEGLLSSIPFFAPDTGLIIIDEIGKMECFSPVFRGLVEEALESDIPLIATVALRGGGLIEEVKGRKDVRLFELTRTNRDELPALILDELNAIRR